MTVQTVLVLALVAAVAFFAVQVVRAATGRTCPACRERVDRRATVCPHCRTGLAENAK